MAATGWRATCRICRHDGQPADSVRVPGATRDVEGEVFTVWRCAACGTLNTLETVDFDRIYRDYPIRRQTDDAFTRLLFAKRLKILQRAGLRRSDTVLDHGCGSGLFVRYLCDHGYAAQGYDPYSTVYNKPEVLARPFDFVTSQDVIEHVDEPAAFLDMLTALVAPGGRLVVGTPYADHVDIHDRIDQLGVLHQPFHRFVISERQTSALFARPGWTLADVIKACYVDTPWPFANTMFLFHLFDSCDGLMDPAFEPLPASHFLRRPSLLFWGLFGRLFARSQDLFAVMVRNDHAPASGGAR